MFRVGATEKEYLADLSAMVSERLHHPVKCRNSSAAHGGGGVERVVSFRACRPSIRVFPRR